MIDFKVPLLIRINGSNKSTTISRQPDFFIRDNHEGYYCGELYFWVTEGIIYHSNTDYHYQVIESGWSNFIACDMEPYFLYKHTTGKWSEFDTDEHELIMEKYKEWLFNKEINDILGE